MTDLASCSEGKYGARLDMYLCHCSSEDDVCPASALRFHTRATEGWQSRKLCIYPQELGFGFGGEVELSYIRVLCHESKIPSRIEVLVAGVGEGSSKSNTIDSYAACSFQRLGYVHFSPGNVGTTARELKTINIHRRCAYVKFLISGPHSSTYNVFNQVGIVALTAHGKPLRSLHCDTKNFCAVGETVEVSLNEMHPPSVGDRMPTTFKDANDREIDTMTFQRISEVSRMKERAVATEDYDLACALKACLISLEEVGREIYRLEKQKLKAVHEEDYALAKKLKSQIDGIRAEAYKAPLVPSAKCSSKTDCEKTDEVVVTDPESPLRAQQPRELSPQKNSSPEPLRTRKPSAFDEMPVNACGRYNIDEAVMTYKGDKNDANTFGHGNGNLSDIVEGKEDWEELLIRTMTQISSGEVDTSPSQAEVSTEARGSEKVFGSYCCGCLFGKKSKLREAAIRAIAVPAVFAALSRRSSNVVESLLTFMALPTRGVSDASPGVVLACCDALQAIVCELSNGPSAALKSLLSPVLHQLVFRLGDSNNRVRYNASFVAASLDIHYIRACPMLCPCPLCDQVTEIATLQQHLITECESKHLVRECPRCKEAVRKEDIEGHIAAKMCIKAVSTHSVCPLCHERFESGAKGWLAHLASPPGCPKNPKKYDGSGPIEV
uniref:TOG domain-containing protein n=1 Tax=Trypanosoma vivax (strain Y486) TaxID=1055687 RepID=G0U4M2_TRYVY|nr:conserved hypothetical protein, fragment [Trypanosoma vivax Y486]